MCITQTVLRCGLGYMSFKNDVVYIMFCKSDSLSIKYENP